VTAASDWRASRLKRLEAAAISAVGYGAVAALGATLRWRVEGLEHLDAPVRSGRQPIMAFWHGRILPATYYFRRRGIVVITSENFDGEWIAGIIRRFGYGTARGSTSRGARRALRQLTRDMAAGRPAAFTLDGPRGPARVAQPGALWLAKVTGNPVIPFHIETDRHWTLGSWDSRFRLGQTKPASSGHVGGCRSVSARSSRDPSNCCRRDNDRASGRSTHDQMANCPITR
jgi:lysophospholipid acyltransferase (LPLAT)-like uncharacterized protein